MNYIFSLFFKLLHFDRNATLASLMSDDRTVAVFLLPTGSEDREVLGVGSIPVAILPSCHYMKTSAL